MGAAGIHQAEASAARGGIVHQVNLEFLASVVVEKGLGEKSVTAYPDTLVGTDSHTPMINRLGILGWGVGGIEAEAALLRTASHFCHAQSLRSPSHWLAEGRSYRN